LAAISASTLRRWMSRTVVTSKPGSLNAWVNEAASNAGSLANDLNEGFQAQNREIFESL
jgi:hypothetical protein